ncbi:MAG TPA: hypothetical protein VJT75_07560 [Thermoleophilaceae bacterium]|nr:hypothetical protein [Thermoleophilaceae bacterium]
MRKSVAALAAVAALPIATGAFAKPALPPVPEPHFISPGDQDVAWFDLAGSSRGDATLIWIEYAAYGHSRLWVRTKRAGGSFGRPRPLTGVHVDAVEAQAAVGEDGTQLVTWVELDRDTQSLKVASRRPDGSFAEKTLASSAKVATTIVYSTEADLEVARDGTALMVLVAGFRGRSRVLAIRRDPDGHWSKPEAVSSGKRGVRYPKVAFDGAGAATLVWERGPREFPDDGASRVKQELRVAVRPPGGRFGRPRKLSKTGEDARDPEVAVNARGDAAVVWNATHGRNLPGSRVGVAVRRAGGDFGPPRLITPPGESFLPRATIGPSGELVAVWNRDRMTKKGFDCGCVAPVTAHGSVGENLGGTHRLAGRIDDAVALARDPAGNAFVTWLRSGRRRDSFDNRVQGRFLGADGYVGPLVRVTPAGDHGELGALLRSNGTALVAWVRYRKGKSRIEAVRTRVRP